MMRWENARCFLDMSLRYQQAIVSLLPFVARTACLSLACIDLLRAKMVPYLYYLYNLIMGAES